ncbi:MAG TPA: hypothetical protein VGF69_22600 [Thermoanaerobaculia bacterium]|jgi:hypothetical protein
MMLRLVVWLLRVLLPEERFHDVLPRFGRERMQRLVRPSPTVIDGAAILGLFHVGPLFAVAAYLDRLPRKAFGIVRQRDDQQRALVFAQAVQHLRGGGLVVMAVDPEQASSRIGVPFRGGTLHLARGAFALARITGAPIVPLAARWRGLWIEIVVGEALSGATEEELAASAAQWLERYLDGAPLTRRLRELMS